MSDGRFCYRRWRCENVCHGPVGFFDITPMPRVLSLTMADVITPLDKLQPCLLDRLTDDEPGKREESRSQRIISLTTLQGRGAS